MRRPGHMQGGVAARVAPPAKSGRRWLGCVLALLLTTSALPDAGAKNADGLRDYRPTRKVSGVIRVWGTDRMGGLMALWQAEFRKYHPDVWFESSLKGTASAQFGLHLNVADLALSGRQIFPYEYYGIYRRSQLHTLEIAVASGSLDVLGKSTAVGVFVHRNNPIDGLSLKQLDGIFGDRRTGGWQRMEWVIDVARGEEGNIRTWGQLGLTGEWADKPIRVYGPPGLHPGGVSFFQTRVMGGADSWNESLQQFDDRAAMMAALRDDPYGIAYGGLAHAVPEVRTLPLSEGPGMPYVAATRKSVADRSYPLSRFAYIYAAPDTLVGDEANLKKDNPKLHEFLSYVLSRQGQAMVSREGDYLPLTADVAQEQLEKLD